MSTVLQKLTILLIDDELLNLKLLTSMLMGTYDVLKARGGRDALTTLEQLHKSKQTDHLLILLDIKMPEMDGFAVLTEIRRNYPQVPVVMCTAVTEYDDIVRAKTLGAVDYIVKPFRVQVVREKVAKIAELKYKQNLPRNH
jgi:CheY-like chemotaxis protein